jgi:hypothetical protein
MSPVEFDVKGWKRDHTLVRRVLSIDTFDPGLNCTGSVSGPGFGLLPWAGAARRGDERSPSASPSVPDQGVSADHPDAGERVAGVTQHPPAYWLARRARRRLPRKVP